MKGVFHPSGKNRRQRRTAEDRVCVGPARRSLPIPDHVRDWSCVVLVNMMRDCVPVFCHVRIMLHSSGKLEWPGQGFLCNPLLNGDVVGVGFFAKAEKAWFTLNGKLLCAYDVPHQDNLNSSRFGGRVIRYPNASVTGNFGSKPFVFEVRNSRPFSTLGVC